MQYMGCLMILRRLAKSAGINKRIHPHLFRHSRATELANHLTQAQMESHLGWIHGSMMPATYIHLSGVQVDDALLKMHGLKQDDPVPILSYQVCVRCKHKNGATSDFCAQCGAALRVETAISTDERREELMLKLMGLVENDQSIARILNGIE
ncbi:tyrosine-type recombinase/integrase [Methanococcoides seepicolus]|uniref:Tyrosine-type recombinase/integrase n=2 Tax=Methanococcoides seepicolus TaxID=2828780 RepID=A0A9E4ZCG9_9EURY|nr:tyrosine-type recombinase/integrase [Methanococcoides seepicolus]